MLHVNALALLYQECTRLELISEFSTPVLRNLLAHHLPWTILTNKNPLSLMCVLYG